MGHALLYAQSGGVTSVINQSAAGVIEACRKYPQIERVLAGHNGIVGILQETLIDCTGLNTEPLLQSPGGYFGSCRFKLPDPEDPEHQVYLARILEVMAAHQVRYFLYNGGGDSQDTLLKVSKYAQRQGYPLQCIGIPKTIDNDLPGTDTSPGYGSAAKYLAVSTAETALDLSAMQASSTKVFIFEVMGRAAGWLAAATALASEIRADLGPDIILFPEVPFVGSRFLERCQEVVDKKGFCFVVLAEGLEDLEHHTLAKVRDRDPFGHPQLGGAAPVLANYVRKHLGLKTHWAVSDYLQRCARHLAAQVDVDQARTVGAQAVHWALEQRDQIMVTIQRIQDEPYLWNTGEIPLYQVANQERLLPIEFISADGYGITAEAHRFLLPLIAGEAYPKYRDGLPIYANYNGPYIPKRLPAFTATSG